jgi:hypothetical protein
MKSNKSNIANMTNEKKIFNRRLALELRKRGFEIIKTEPNFYKPEFDVYIFKDSVELDSALTEITQRK